MSDYEQRPQQREQAPTLAARIRARFALAVGKRDVVHDCPSDKDILAWHERSTSRSVADPVATHVAHCDACFAVWTGLLQMEQDNATVSSISTPARASPWSWLVAARQRWTNWSIALPLGAAAAGILMAAVLGVALWDAGPDSAAFARYELRSSGQLLYRGDSAADAVLTAGRDSLLELVLTPETAMSGPLEMRLYAVAGERLAVVPATSHVTDKGVAWIEGIVGRDIVVPPAATGLVVVLGRPDRLPAPERLARSLGADLAPGETSRSGHWVAWHLALRNSTAGEGTP